MGNKQILKKIFLMAYARKNLGDDFFIKMLLDRYPMHHFYMKILDYSFLSELDQYINLHIIQEPDTDENLSRINVNDYDAYIYIGGSIFMEGGKVYNLSNKFYDFVKKCKDYNKPFCYVSCNYGPYNTQEYFELSKRNFEICTDICFRDKYSYNLFSYIKNVRYAPDFAYTYPIKDEGKIPNSVGISVIDLSIRCDLKNKENDYINMLAKNITNYVNDGKRVYLFSFCKYEGDESAIKKIINKLDSNKNVYVIKYDGNIDNFINIYSKMEYNICARFHAMILSCIAKQKAYVMSYSKKIENVINDLNLNLPVLNFKDVNENLIINLSDFSNIESDKIDLIIEDAKEQEKVVKQILE